MNRLPIHCLLSFSLCALTVLAGCERTSEEGSSSPTESRPTLYYFTWSDYAGPEIIREFEEQARVKVVVDTFSSNEELLAKLQSGASGYDVAVPSDFMVSIMASQGFLAELELTKIPNVTKLLERLQGLPFDPENRYSIPYLWGTVGIAYDSAIVSPPPDSWSVLWDPRYKGKISMLNDQREVFGATLRYMGESMNSRDAMTIEAAKGKLLAQKPLVKTYTSELYDQLLVAGEVVLAHGWGGTVARAMVERPSIRYAIPKEGGTIWADCLVVLRTSRKKDLAMQFVNFLLDREIAARTTQRLLFASSNREAKALVPAEIRMNPAVYPPDSVIERMEWMTDVGEAIRLYDRAWTELKMG